VVAKQIVPLFALIVAIVFQADAGHFHFGRKPLRKDMFTRPGRLRGQLFAPNTLAFRHCSIVRVSPESQPALKLDTVLRSTSAAVFLGGHTPRTLHGTLHEGRRFALKLGMSIHSILPPDPPNPIEAGDLVMRKKRSGLGWHYGTGLSNGNVAHTMPETGKTIESLDDFSAGLPVFIQRFNRTQEENSVVEWRGLSNLGQQYIGEVANCEHDATMAQFGVAFSPTVNGLKVVGGLGLALLFVKALTDRD